MRYKFYLSKAEIWWNNETENKPSDKYFWDKNFNWVEIDKQIRYTSQISAELVCNDMSVQYVRVVDSMDEIETRYYYVNSFAKETVATVLYSLVLDIWTTYILPFFERNQDTSINVIRTHIKNKNAFQLNDNALDSIPIVYKNKVLNKYTYPHTISGANTEYAINLTGDYTAKSITLETADTINGNVCYVFSGGLDDTNNEYIFVPVMSKLKNPLYKASRATKGSEIEKIYIHQDSQLINAQFNYERIMQEYPDAIISINQSFVPNFTQPRELSFIFQQTQWKRQIANPFGESYAYYSRTYQQFFINSALVYTYDEYNVNYPPLFYPPYPEIQEIIYTFYRRDGAPIPEQQVINNNLVAVDKLKDNPDLIKKFIGVYFTPNFLAMYRVLDIAKKGSFKDFMYFSVNAAGVPIDSLTISNFQEVMTPDKYDSIEINNDIILKYYQISYFGNNKSNWNYWLVNSQIVLTGLFVFNGNANIICYLDNLKAKDSIISFPYQLPSATDGYISYYSGIMSNINNGIKQQEIQYNMQLSSQGLNLLPNLIGNLTNKPSGASALSQGLSTGFGFAGIERQNNAFYAGLKAQFEDVKRTTSTNFSPSNVNDTASILTNFSFGANAEIVEIWVPDDSSLKLLNNVLYWQGILFPNTYKISEITPRVNFNYLQIENKWLQNWIPFYIVSTQNIKSSIISILSQGVRLWNVEPGFNYEN